MINKQNLWFLTLFSLILVLSIFYLTMGDSDLTSKITNNTETVANIDINESDVLTALRVDADEERLKEMEALQEILLDTKTTIEDKNNAYETLKDLNLNKGKEEKLEKIILDTYKLQSFVKIKNDQINIVVASKDHDESLANNIIRTIQKEYESQMYITVKFQ